MTADQFVALWGNGSAAKELRAIKPQKGRCPGKRERLKEEEEEEAITEIEEQIKEDCLSSNSNY